MSLRVRSTPTPYANTCCRASRGEMPRPPVSRDSMFVFREGDGGRGGGGGAGTFMRAVDSKTRKGTCPWCDKTSESSSVDDLPNSSTVYRTAIVAVRPPLPYSFAYKALINLWIFCVHRKISL